jgi:hypothetical protein
MRLEHETNTHPRLLRKSASGEPDAKSGSKKQADRGQAQGTRFVGATHLDDQRKSAISRALKEQEIGDEIGRQIFVCAVEYQLTVHGPQLGSRSPPNPEALEREAELTAAVMTIAETAGAMLSLLRALPESSRSRLSETLTAQDTLRRTYDDRYLCELGNEMGRLQRAAAAAAEAVQLEEIPDDPAPSRDFVTNLVKAYAECFEQRPTAAADGGFSFALQTLGEVTGLVIGYEPAFLAEILPAT